MKQIVIINGIAGSGKDTFVDYIGLIMKNVSKMSYIRDVKHIASDMGWDGKKDNKSRRFLSDIEDLWTAYNNGVFKKVISRIEDELSPNVTYFIMVRKTREIEKLKRKYKRLCLTVLIKRPGVKVPDNPADKDAAISRYKYDVVIENIGTTKDLEDKAIKFAEEYLVNYELQKFNINTLNL